MTCLRAWTLLILASALVVLVAGCKPPPDDPAASRPAEEAAGGPDAPGTPDLCIQLSDEKIAAAGISCLPIGNRQLCDTDRVPGRIDYDASRRLELRVPVACMVKEVLAAPSQRVAKGDPLAVLSSIEIGLARNEIAQREADLQLACMQNEWTVEIGENVEAFLDHLAQQPSTDELHQRFAGKRLGEHREQLVSAYSKLLLAKQLLDGSEGLHDSGVLSGRTMQQRQSDLDIARAAFQSACDESRRQASIQKSQAAAAVSQAERLLQVSREHLRALLGPFSDSTEADDQAINEFVLCCPFDGTIQQQDIVAAMQVPANEPMLLLADTDMMWVCAQIQERRWAALSVRPGQALQVESPALPDRMFTAQVKFVGAVVSPENLAVPLVAELENAEGLFRPGMFVWTTVPTAEARTALAAPQSAVLRHDHHVFVFVTDDDRNFRRVDVITGLETPDWIEVTSGLTAGQRVVHKGAFYLKSELLLERETD